jgi:transcriptional regulator with XRE-family HTH domain
MEAKNIIEAKEIGAKIKELRIAAGVSQSKLSEIVGLSTRQIIYIEGGKRLTPHLKYLQIIKALGYEISYNLLNLKRTS